jgi:hypothetical protein
MFQCQVMQGVQSDRNSTGPACFEKLAYRPGYDRRQSQQGNSTKTLFTINMSQYITLPVKMQFKQCTCGEWVGWFLAPNSEEIGKINAISATKRSFTPSELRSTDFHESPNYRTAPSGQLLYRTQIGQEALTVRLQTRLFPSINHVTEPRLLDKLMLRTCRVYHE